MAEKLTAEEIKAAEEAKAAEAAKAKAAQEAADAAAAKIQLASLADLKAAVAKGSEVRVLMPEGTSSITVEGQTYKSDEDGVFSMHIRHGLHMLESFGGRILAAAEKPFRKPAAK